ncbi:AAA family ATPase [Mycolicibacterium thermoresistibile]|jgi:MoxR-like ATPase|uniref:ATPase, MoxR family protein n=2 Tax=Mycolicibacterium thermoresistibile TaxID=1797 RepID=G7CHE0_MYCT3|nr:AAA family ATPase [Mycolicibacterium thermoresistibile]EHI12250.1 ATPase, MoxR family protein [Mycolicibacterium thermoresistibile ATCC 19527]MCV7191040.1 AAA family ATPase [Mycolicibacterium thermoresistibile]GAT15617.1 ATPase, MoxR family protein [Mycolicibacterium thermoresistibile]SNW16833.1 ATPase [Mycolicibacterium thermoresistibile]
MTAARLQLNREDLEEARRIVDAVSAAFSQKVVGQHDLRESLLISLLAGGHILLESVPGLAKTTAARVIADTIHGGFQRIQCTPDLLPSDIIGTQVYDAATNAFVTRLGPVHTNIVLLDEINRSSAKTQSAMLEAMEERQTTIAGTVYPIPEPFLVIATQNPVDQEGTYPLSEAQTDRFMLKEIVRYPSPDEEVEVLTRMDAGLYDRHTPPVVTLDDIRRLQQIVRTVHMDRALMHYASTLVAATREPERYLPRQLARLVEYGASPRATIAFAKAARALALLSGRDHVLPEDIAGLSHRVLRHRLILGFEAASAGVTPEVVIDAVRKAVRVP